ncbi:unnamed protein product [Pleuronectes platessa]|uniref:LIM domain only protein 3 n=1 Tax=Pleuronectes platessa TaxID=8262 RepID=A0A9N7V552_PLEPL|nr:unnamed protein product [Pleuronectes platessa]
MVVSCVVKINLYGPNKWSLLTSKGWEDGAVPCGKGNAGPPEEPELSSPSHLTGLSAVHCLHSPGPVPRLQQTTGCKHRHIFGRRPSSAGMADEDRRGSSSVPAKERMGEREDEEDEKRKSTSRPSVPPLVNEAFMEMKWGGAGEQDVETSVSGGDWSWLQLLEQTSGFTGGLVTLSSGRSKPKKSSVAPQQLLERAPRTLMLRLAKLAVRSNGSWGRVCLVQIIAGRVCGTLAPSYVTAEPVSVPVTISMTAATLPLRGTKEPQKQQLHSSSPGGLFGVTGNCAACSKLIPAFEMVMRAKENVYHLDCFACQLCNQRFCVGDKFFLKNNMILCQTDYEEGLMKEGYAPQVR